MSYGEGRGDALAFLGSVFFSQSSRFILPSRSRGEVFALDSLLLLSFRGYIFVWSSGCWGIVCGLTLIWQVTSLLPFYLLPPSKAFLPNLDEPSIFPGPLSVPRLSHESIDSERSWVVRFSFLLFLPFLLLSPVLQPGLS